MNTRSYCFVQTACASLSSRRATTASIEPSSFVPRRHHVIGRFGRRYCRLPAARRRDSNVLPPQQCTFSISMAADKPSSSLPMRVASVLILVGFIAATFVPAIGLFRNATTDAGDKILESQLGKVPVFTVTDDTGRPLLSETEDHRLRRGFFFLQYTDAKAYMEKVKESNSDAKVLTVGLNEAVKYLETRSTPAKAVPERFELFPDDHEAELARKVTDGDFQRRFGNTAVPVFYVEGLAFKDDKDQVAYPLFFEKEKLDEMIQDLKQRDPSSSLSLNDLQVIDLKQTIAEIRTGANPRLNRVVFVPLTDSMKAMSMASSAEAAKETS